MYQKKPSQRIPLVKRLIDITLSLLALIVFSPILILLCIAILFIEGKPVFFKQLRPGFMGKPFYIYKFRTMRQAKSGDDSIEKDAHRLTALGKLLRSTSLDELPELWNILRGDMSIVGPRPLLMQYLPLYSAEQMRRHDVLPGLTGWAQVNGRNALSWEDKFILDVWYVDHWSLWLDIRIIWMTFWKTIRREGISQEGEVTAREWKG